MPRRVLRLLLLFAGFGRASGADFDKAVAPVLIKHCVACHNAAEARGGLDLTRKETAFQGGKSGPALTIGKPEASYLLERVVEGSMPPPKKGPPLTATEVALLRTWIETGANWPAGRVLSGFDITTDRRAGYDWWSLQPLKRAALPQATSTDHTIDAFLREALGRRNLVMAPPADRATLIRRATFDLLGLPPTPGEIDDFADDLRPDAFERLLDRLLASPRYGERWGRHWLDVARYTESDGFENDKLRDHAWHYRDFVVRAFNEDRPYAQFVREQLAGDALRPATREGLIGSGFLVAGPWDEIQNVAASPTERKRAHEEQMEELIAAVGQTFLGLTLHCARCHDHKFDPIPQADYYRIKAIFDGVDHGNRPLSLPDEGAEIERRSASLKARLAEVMAALQPGKTGLLEAGALVDGRFGKALDSRRGRFEAAAKPTFQEPPLTVECWVRLDGSANFNILVANNLKESSDHWELYTYAGAGDFSVYLPGFAPAEIRSGVNVADGKWHYLAWTFDGTRARLFVDAKLVKEQIVARQKAAGVAGRIWFGAYPPQNIGCDGALDEVRISKGLRPVERVPTGPFANDGQTLGLWHFDVAETPLPPIDHKDDLQNERVALEGQLAALAPPLVYAGQRRQPGPTHVLLRGDIRQLGPPVSPAGLSALRGISANLGLAAESSEGERRRRFADWVAHPENPLTARVLVNRLWQHHFGQGFVDTPSDFGFNGGRPSHPELLDWLARDFLDGGGRIKRMHKRIMSSAAYRQSSRFDSRAAGVDGDDRLLWRFAPRRLEGEIVRDAMLAVSGELNPRLGGPSFRPFTVTIFLTHFYNLFDRDDPEFNRRSIYRANVNTGRSPLLDALDCPAPSIAAPNRKTTTTPMQALALMNDPFVVRQANRLARRVRRDSGDRLERQLSALYRLAFGRLPTAAERDAAGKVARAQGLETVCWAILNASEFLYVK